MHALRQEGHGAFEDGGHGRAVWWEHGQQPEEELGGGEGGRDKITGVLSHDNGQVFLQGQVGSSYGGGGYTMESNKHPHF